MCWKVLQKTIYLFYFVMAVIAVSGCANNIKKEESISQVSDDQKSFELNTKEVLSFFVFKNVKTDNTFGIYVKGDREEYCLTADESGVNKVTFDFMFVRVMVNKPFYCNESFIRRASNYGKFAPGLDLPKYGKIFIGKRRALLIEAKRSGYEWRYRVRSIPTDIQPMLNAVGVDNVYVLDGYVAKRILAAQDIFDEIQNWPEVIKSRAATRPQNIAEAIQKRLSSISDDEIKFGIKKISKAHEKILHSNGLFGIWHDRFRSHINKNSENAKKYLLLMRDHIGNDNEKIFEESLISFIGPWNIWEVKNCRKISQHDNREDVHSFSLSGFIVGFKTGSKTKRNVKLSCIVDIRKDAIYKPSYRYNLRGYGKVDFVWVAENEKEKKESLSYVSDDVLWEGNPVSITLNIDNIVLSHSTIDDDNFRLKSYNVYAPLIEKAAVN